MKDKLNNKVAVSPSVPLNCSTAADRHATIECGECGVLTTPDRADFAEGDGGMIPDSWVCHKCQSSVPDDPYFYSDLEDDYEEEKPLGYDDPNCCEHCGDDLDKGGFCWSCDF